MDWVKVGSLVATVLALGLSVHFWRRQFRPIVTAMVKTHKGGNVGIAYNLVVLNSGSIPARDIWFEVADTRALDAAFALGAQEADKKSGAEFPIRI
ncbi:hypothetical protein EN822_27000, partial [bacterium M00.F.Ca.ET.179.01.1.1]